MKSVLFALALLIVINNAESQSTYLRSEKKYDVAYGSFPSSKMDVYLPVNRSKATPFVIMIHGGGWVSDDKKSYNGSQQILLEQGIASANINYRFADSLKTHYQQMLDDIDSAVNYCMANAKKWNTRKTNLVFMGASAGGHLALLYAYLTSKKVNAIIAKCTPTDLADTGTLAYEASIGVLNVICKMTGASYTAGQTIDPKFFASSPIYHVKNIPTLIIHGTDDKIVPYQQAIKLDDKLSVMKIQHKLIPIPGADHDMNMKDPATRDMIYKEIVDWIWKYNK